MTEITVFLKDGKPIGFDAHGHTGYAECGEDIVCAAVSAITQTAAMGVSDLSAARPHWRLKTEGSIWCLKKPLKVQNCSRQSLYLERCSWGFVPLNKIIVIILN